MHHFASRITTNAIESHKNGECFSVAKKRNEIIIEMFMLDTLKKLSYSMQFEKKNGFN